MPADPVTTIIAPPDEAAAMRQALYRHAEPIPSTKGMDPRQRAQRLHAELERRIADAKEVLHGKRSWNDHH